MKKKKPFVLVNFKAREEEIALFKEAAIRFADGNLSLLIRLALRDFIEAREKKVKSGSK